MPDPALARQMLERRTVEDALLKLGEKHGEIEAVADMNRVAIRSWLERARSAGITVRDISRMTGYSTQTLHTWYRELMKPIPAAHLGQAGPPPAEITEAVLRTIAEDIKRFWTAPEVQAAIPSGWPTGSVAEVDMALDMLHRSGQIWQTDDGFRIAPPDE
jgi:hypothetical protein